MMGGIARAVGGAPSYSTVSLTKNPALQSQIDAAIGNYGQLSSGINSALGDYQRQYMAGEGAARTATGQEIGAIGQFYNGAMSNQLAQLRAQRSQALTNAANVASQQALAAQNRSRVAGGGGGGSSYESRLAMANLTPIQAQAAVDNANQARADLGYVTQNQLGLTGQRNALQAAQAAYGLVPQEQRLQMMGQQAGYLGQLGNLDQANKFYGVQQAPNEAADILDSMDQGIMNAASIYSSIGTPGMGGGAGKARGGEVHGPGSSTSDSIPARLSNREYVIPAEALEFPGMKEHLDSIRRLALLHRSMKQYDYPGTSTGTYLPGMPHYRSGGMVLHYSDGGMTGYADGGLAGSAAELGERATADTLHGTQWMPATMVGQGVGQGAGVGVGGGWPGMGGGGGMVPGTNLMPGQVPPSRYFQPTNESSLSPMWDAYGRYWSNFYSNPSSPGYVQPGTYE